MNGVELVASWFTPTVLFCVLNLMIGTIFFTSTIKPTQNQQHSENEGEEPPQLGRVSSILERVKSINLSRYQSDQPDGEQPPQLGRVPSFLERVKSINLSRYQSDQPEGEQSLQLGQVPSFLERVKSINLSRHRSEQPEPAVEQPVHQQEPQHDSEESHHMMRTKSDAVAKAKPAAKVLKKSASEKAVANKREEEERRPATVRERTEVTGGDDAVDERADDFINRFRQQLKLQRLDSILRYTDMLNRGAAR